MCQLSISACSSSEFLMVSMPNSPRISGRSCARFCSFSNLTARFSLGQKLDMLRPWQCDEHTHAGTCATIEKPSRWNMVDPHHVEAGLAHQRQIGVNLLRSSEIISVCVRLERTIGDPFKKKFPIAFEKEFRDRANARVGAHSGSFLVHATDSRKVDRLRRLLGPMLYKCDLARLNSIGLATARVRPSWWTRYCSSN